MLTLMMSRSRNTRNSHQEPENSPGGRPPSTRLGARVVFLCFFLIFSVCVYGVDGVPVSPAVKTYFLSHDLIEPSNSHEGNIKYIPARECSEMLGSATLGFNELVAPILRVAEVYGRARVQVSSSQFLQISRSQTQEARFLMCCAADKVKALDEELHLSWIELCKGQSLTYAHDYCMELRTPVVGTGHDPKILKHVFFEMLGEVMNTNTRPILHKNNTIECN